MRIMPRFSLLFSTSWINRCLKKSLRFVIYKRESYLNPETTCVAGRALLGFRIVGLLTLGNWEVSLLTLGNWEVTLCTYSTPFF